MNLYIENNVSNPRKTYEIIENEELFFNQLFEKSISNGLNLKFSMVRLSNGTINVDYASYPIGKIKLQGRTNWMMVMKNIYDSKQIEGSLQNYIDGIDEWFLYIKKYLKKELRN